MNPAWPSMLMSSTLARDSSSVLRSRPMGLPRYQVNEKCGPRMPPPTSHWQPTELRAVFTSPGIRVSSMSVWSLMPPHCGKNGPCAAFCACGASDGGASGESGCALEQAATKEIMAAATTASAFAGLLPITACTVAGSLTPQPRHAD